MTYTPSLEQRSAMRPARAASPSITGMIGCSPGLEREAGLRHAGAEEARVLEQLRAQLRGLLAADPAPRDLRSATTGGMLLEKR